MFGAAINAPVRGPLAEFDARELVDEGSKLSVGHLRNANRYARVPSTYF